MWWQQCIWNKLYPVSLLVCFGVRYRNIRFGQSHMFYMYYSQTTNYDKSTRSFSNLRSAGHPRDPGGVGTDSWFITRVSAHKSRHWIRGIQWLSCHRDHVTVTRLSLYWWSMPALVWTGGIAFNEPSAVWMCNPVACWFHASLDLPYTMLDPRHRSSFRIHYQGNCKDDFSIQDPWNKDLRVWHLIMDSCHRSRAYPRLDTDAPE